MMTPEARSRWIRTRALKPIADRSHVASDSTEEHFGFQNWALRTTAPSRFISSIQQPTSSARGRDRSATRQ